MSSASSERQPSQPATALLVAPKAVLQTSQVSRENQPAIPLSRLSLLANTTVAATSSRRKPAPTRYKKNGRVSATEKLKQRTLESHGFRAVGSRARPSLEAARQRLADEADVQEAGPAHATPLLPLALVQPKCEGYAIAFPANKSPHLDYPFALHGPQAHGEPLPWRYEAVNDQTMNLISSGCTNVASPDYDSPRCPPCQGIGLHKRFPGVMECIQGAQKPNAPLRNYGIGGLIEKDRQKRACIDNLLFCLRQYESRPQH